MSESSVTEKDVFDAADELLAAGKRVSNRTVYNKLGRRGSMDTICPLLRKWRSLRNVATKSSGEDPPISDPVMARAMELVNQLRQEAKAEATKEIEAARVTCAGEVKAAEVERDSAIADATDADAELVVIKEERDRLQEECKAAIAHIVEYQNQLRDTDARAVAAEARVGELRKHASVLQSELSNSHRMHDEERERNKRLRAELERMRVEADSNVVLIANTVSDANHARALAAQAKEQSEKAEAAATRRIDAMASECEQARREAKDSGERAAGLQRELAAVKQKSEDLYALIKDERSRSGGSAVKQTKSNVN